MELNNFAILSRHLYYREPRESKLAAEIVIDFKGSVVLYFRKKKACKRRPEKHRKLTNIKESLVW